MSDADLDRQAMSERLAESMHEEEPFPECIPWPCTVECRARHKRMALIAIDHIERRRLQ